MVVLSCFVVSDITSTAITSVGNIIRQSKIEVCNANQLTLKKNYKHHIVLRKLDQISLSFNQFVMN